ncbi:MAG TPA: hypothetical protein PK514_11300 [Spirochaetota bacterium]|nr:hypothetical protein [Spirochaetota bacterium]
MKSLFTRSLKLIRNIIVILTISGMSLFLMESRSLSAKDAYLKKTVTTKSELNLRETLTTDLKCTVTRTEKIEDGEEEKQNLK